MARRKKKSEDERPAYPESWEVSEEFQHNGRWLRPGTEFTVHGVKGRLRFIRYVVNTQTETAWVDCFSQDKQFRAFRPERIKTVHSKNRTRENNDG